VTAGASGAPSATRRRPASPAPPAAIWASGSTPTATTTTTARDAARVPAGQQSRSAPPGRSSRTRSACAGRARARRATASWRQRPPPRPIRPPRSRAACEARRYDRIRALGPYRHQPGTQPIVTVSIDFHDGNGFQQVLSTPAPPNRRPPTIRLHRLDGRFDGHPPAHHGPRPDRQPAPVAHLVKQVVTAGIPLPPPVGQVSLPVRRDERRYGPGRRRHDRRPAGDRCHVPAQHLEPNQTETCTGSYVLTAADLAQGSLENTAVADGTTLNGARLLAAVQCHARLRAAPRPNQGHHHGRRLFRSARCSPTATT